MCCSTNNTKRRGKEIAFVVAVAATAYLPLADADSVVQSLPEGHKGELQGWGVLKRTGSVQRPDDADKALPA